MFWLGTLSIGVIWLAVLVISLGAPDLVSGSEQEHVALPAILTWIWGLIATRSIVTLLVAQRGTARSHELTLLVGAVSVVWIVATAVAVFGPVMVTGTDPTHMPLAAILAPIVAMVITNTICQLFTSLYPPGETVGHDAATPQPSA